MKLYLSLQTGAEDGDCHWWSRTKSEATATHQAMVEQLEAEGAADGHVATKLVDYPVSQRSVIDLANGKGVEFLNDHPDVQYRIIYEQSVAMEEEEIEVEVENED